MKRIQQFKSAFSDGKMPVVREIDAKRGAAAMLYNPDLTDPAMCAKAVMWAQAVPGGKITAEEIRFRRRIARFVGYGRGNRRSA